MTLILLAFAFVAGFATADALLPQRRYWIARPQVPA